MELAENQRLVELPGHGGLGHAVPPEVANRGPESGHALRLPTVAQFPQCRVGMVLDRQAVNVMALGSQRLSHDDRISPPGGQQADLARTAAAHAASCRVSEPAACSNWVTVCCSVRNCFFSSGNFCSAARISSLLPFRRRRDADIGCPGRDVVHHARLGADRHPVADIHVIANADLAGHDHVVTGGRTAGDADLRANDVVPSDAAVVGDHHMVVDFRPVADHGRTVRATVDRRASADFHVVAQFDVAQLGGQPVPARDGRVSEAVRADHRARVDQGARSHHRVFVQHDVGKQHGVLAQPATRHDLDTRVNHGPVAHGHVIADDGVGVNDDVASQPGRGADDGRGGDADPVVLQRRAEEGHDPRKRLLHIGHGDEGDPLRPKVRRRNYRRRAAGGQPTGQAGIVGKRDVAGLRVADNVRAGDRDATVPLQLPVDHASHVAE